MSDTGNRFDRKLLGIYTDAQCKDIAKDYPNAKIEQKQRPNSMAKPADIEAARSTAIWPDATLEQLQDKDALLARLPALIAEHKAVIESYGLKY